MAHYVLILGGGQGIRLNNKIPKQFLELKGMPIIMHSVNAFLKSDPKSHIYIGLPKNYISKWSSLIKKYNFHINHTVFIGGQTRSETVYLGIQRIVQDNKSCVEDIISIHDGARPFIDSTFISDLISNAKKYGGSVPVLSLKNALIRNIIPTSTRNTKKNHSTNRQNYKITQTPQIFNLQEIETCYSQLYDLISKEENIESILSNIFDDLSVYEKFKETQKSSTYFVCGREYNIKITTPMDYYMAPYIYDFFTSIT